MREEPLGLEGERQSESDIRALLGEVAALREELARQGRDLAVVREELSMLRSRLGPIPSTSPGVASESAPPPDSSPHPADSGEKDRPVSPAAVAGRVDASSSRAEKVRLFRRLFTGRDDVWARRWENRAKATSGWAPARAGTWATPKDQREYLPLTDTVVEAHLAGRETVGLYPLLTDDTCRLLVCDFDASMWRLDAQAYAEAAGQAGVPTAVEISRSGDGAHVWTFFTAPVSAAAARALGAALLREAMALRGELDLDSYDRFFPSQDQVPERSFGNLIALPLQGESRRHGTTVFVDPRTYTPWPDQFAFLAGVDRMSPAQVHRVVDALEPVSVGPQVRLRASRVRPDPAPPPQISARLAGMLSIRRAGIPPGLYVTLKHLATLHNPAFHKNENLRLSNHATPRFIRCYVEDLEHLHLPRGVQDQAAAIIADAGSVLDVVDERTDPDPIELAFHGELREEQRRAVDVLRGHDLGVLEAPPGTGKTVMACAVMAHHATPTLVLVDRKPLLSQWKQRLRTHLQIDAGQIGGGKKSPSGVVDIAMVQTVTRSDDPGELLDGYGLIVVDECHHVPAPTVERAVRSVDARRWLGLTATPQRSDGLKDIMLMHCGPIRHRLAEPPDDLIRTLHVHDTDLRIDLATDGLTRGEILALLHAALVDDPARTGQVCQDVAAAVRDGRHCLALSSRVEHVERLAAALADRGLDPLVLHGGLKPTQRRAVEERLDRDDPILLVATDRYIGEGFDCPRLDTLFLTFPLSARQRLTQYVGRILRPLPTKDSVEVHDYHDVHVPIFAAMFRRRSPGYKPLGFITNPTIDPRRMPRLPPTGPPTTGTSPSGSPESSAAPPAATVRTWARRNGYEVSDRGPLSAEVRAAYERAHSRDPDRPASSSS